MSTKASLKLVTSNQNPRLLREIENAAKDKRLRYIVAFTELASFGEKPSEDSSGGTTLTKMQFATTSIGLISAFLIQMQPTIQELIKNDALNQISISCERKSVNIQGKNKIEDAIELLKELECDSNTK